MTTADIDHVFINTKSRLLSTDFNDQTRLTSRALIESLSAAALQDQYKVIAGVGGVIAGFEVRAVPASNKIEVRPGIALIPGVPTDVILDPPLVWVELQSPVELDLAADIDLVNPRLVTIEIEPGTATKRDQIRDFFDPLTGTFGSALVPTIVGSAPLISRALGAAVAAPVVPAGTVGRLPLAIVKLATAQASFTDAFVSVLMCRPLLWGGGFTLIPPNLSIGGGFTVGRESGGTIIDRTITTISDSLFEVNGLPARARGEIDFADARTPVGFPPAALLNNVQPVYGYIAPPPWAADYGAIADRECSASNPNTLDLTVTAESIVLGDGGTFKSLSWFAGNRQVGLTNGIVFFDLIGPNAVTFPIGASGRVVDLRAPHQTTAAGGTITLDATQDPTWGATQEVTVSSYVGTMSSLGAGNFMAQSYRGSGHVLITDLDTQRPGVALIASTGGQVPLYPGHFPDMTLIGDPEILPLHSGTVDISGSVLGLGFAAPGSVALIIGGPLGWGGQVAIGNAGHWRASWDNLDLPGQASFAGPAIPIARDQAEAGILQFTGGAGVATADLALVGYHDMILASR